MTRASQVDALLCSDTFASLASSRDSNTEEEEETQDEIEPEEEEKTSQEEEKTSQEEEKTSPGRRRRIDICRLESKNERRRR